MGAANIVDEGGEWLCLFSGGKDSSWSLYRAHATGRTVDRLITVDPPTNAYLYHVPATELTSLAAESMGLPITTVDARDVGNQANDSTAHGDAELEPLEDAISALVRDGTDVAGIVVGAVESTFQHSRIERLASRFDAELFAPLWHRDPESIARKIISAGFESYFVEVAAAGLDRGWLGRRYDLRALDDLKTLNERYGVHLLGEGGEFETLVTDGPHMDRPIRFEGEPEWHGDRGRLRITEASLGN